MSEGFYVMMVAAVISMMMLGCRILYKCKFDNINLCYGALQCHRNVLAEEKIDIDYASNNSGGIDYTSNNTRGIECQTDDIPTPSLNLSMKKPS